MIFTTLPLLDITNGSTVESVLKMIGLLILCAIIIAASYFVTRFVGKKQMGIGGETNFKSLDVYRVNQNKYLQLIRIGKRYFVIAVGKDTVTMLTELSKDDITYWRSDDKTPGFKEILAKAMGTKTPENDDSTTDSKKSEE